MKTVSVIWVKGLLQAASLQGVSENAVLTAAGLPEETLSAAGGRISLSDTLLLWRAVELLSEDSLFGFHMGQSLQPTHFQLIAFTMLSSETLASAVDKILKYQRLISDGGAFSLIPHGQESALIYRPLESDFSYHQIDAVIAAVVHFTRWLLGQEGAVLEIRLQHDFQSGLGHYQKYYQAPVLLNQTDNRIVFDSALLEQRLPGYDQNLATVHEQMADSQLRRLLEPSIIAQVQEQLMASQADVSRDEVAQSMAMSGRSLQRKLQQEGSSFQQLFDEFRHQRSLLLLQDKQNSLADIGQALGFSENSTFYRAFKRWQGVTPGEYRQVLLETKTQS